MVDILLDFVTKTNDRREKILDFHHPGQMKESLDLQIPDKPLNLDQLLVDCKDTLKYGVKTGQSLYIVKFLIHQTNAIDWSIVVIVIANL